MITTNPWIAPEPIVRQLATRDGFEKAVEPASGVRTALHVALVTGAVLLAYNVVSTIQTLSRNGAPASRFFEVFFSTDGETASDDVKLYLFVWGPAVVIPVALVLLVLVRATRDSRYESAFASYSSGGYAAWALGLPFTFASGRSRFVPQVVLPAEHGTEEVAQWFDRLAVHVRGLDKAGSKQLAKSLVRSLKQDDVAIPAASVFPGAPPFALLVRASTDAGAQTIRAVMPAGSGTTVRAYRVQAKNVQSWS